MGKLLLLTVFIVLSMHSTVFAQVETEHFVYVPEKGVEQE